MIKIISSAISSICRPNVSAHSIVTETGSLRVLIWVLHAGSGDRYADGQRISTGPFKFSPRLPISAVIKNESVTTITDSAGYRAYD
ncbi:hypothetical protein YTPLAS18_26940 [Nitrospira sp.]|nr:hypothetical protein YTPLAS18_26940 [Nitrospira sp.]